MGPRRDNEQPTEADLTTRWTPLLLFVVTCPVHADQVIWLGETYAFAGPRHGYDPETGFEITISYGSQSTTIGDGFWRAEVGIYDLTQDPDCPEFLSYAANGQADLLTVAIADGQGHRVEYEGGGGEADVFGRYGWIDLFPLEVTGAQLNLRNIFTEGVAGVAVRWEFLGIPEPSTALMILATLAPLARRRILR